MNDSTFAAKASALNQPTTSSARSVLVTGASRGIGRAIAAAFVAAGERVTGVCQSESGLKNMPAGVLGVRADVTDSAQMAQAVQIARRAHGRVTVLVTAAGISHESLAARTSLLDWESTLNTNLTGSFLPIQAVLPGMLSAHQGKIVLLSSVSATRGGTGLAAYAASKAGVEGLTRSLARELAGRGITVNAVAPGFTDTDMTARLDESVREQYLREIPLGRFAAVEEIAAPVLFLASPQASYLTGTVLTADGGLGMGR